MNKFLSFLTLFLFLGGLTLTGCSAKKAESPKEAIEAASQMGSAEKQADYLLQQANAFYKAKEYKEAIELATHVSGKLNVKTEEAQKLVEKAKADMTAMASKMAEDAKKALGGFGK